MATRVPFNGATAPVPWKNTGIPEGLGDQYSRLIRTLFKSSHLPLTAVGGTGNVVTASLDPVLDSDGLVDGMRFGITWGAANTGAVTLAINGGSAVPVRDNYGAVLVAGRLAAGRRDLLEYIGGHLRIINGDATADTAVALTAFASGQAGQPRLLAAAFPTFAVGAVEIINFTMPAGTAQSKTKISGANSQNIIGVPQSWQAIKAGTLRYSVEMRKSGTFTGGTDGFHLFKNGTQIAFVAATTSWATYTSDFSFAAGDEISTSISVTSTTTQGGQTDYRDLRLLGDQRGLFRL